MKFFRSSRPEVYCKDPTLSLTICKDGFLNSFPGKHRKTLAFDSLFNKFQARGLQLKNNSAQVFSCGFLRTPFSSKHITLVNNVFHNYQNYLLCLVEEVLDC